MNNLARALVLISSALVVQGTSAIGTCCTSPIARDDAATVTLGTPSIIDVLANDSDADGEPLVVTSVSSTCAGTVSSEGDGTLLFTPPAAGTAGTCRIDYQIADVAMRTASASVTVTVTAGGGPGPTGDGTPVALDPRDPRRVIYQGQPIFLAGYYPGLAPHILEERIAAGYTQNVIDQAAAADLNLLRVALTTSMAIEGGTAETFTRIHPYRRSGQCCTNHAGELGVAGEKLTLNGFEDSFFTYWDGILEHAYQRDMIIQLAIFEASHTKNVIGGDPMWVTYTPYGLYYDYYKAGNNTSGVDLSSTVSDYEWYEKPQVVNEQLQLVERTVEALCRHPNLIWETANEAIREAAEVAMPAFGDRTWHQVIADEIRRVEDENGCDRHLIMPLDLPDHREVKGHWTPGRDQSDADFRTVHNQLVTQFASRGAPLVTDNDCCTDPGPKDLRRRKAWLSLVSGAYPSLFHFEADLANVDDGAESMRQVGYVRRFLLERAIDVAGMVPGDQVLSGVPADRMVWALVRPDAAAAGGFSEYIVYFFRGGEATLAALPSDPSAYSAEWFDPTLGSFSPAPAGPTFRVPATPAGQDWVLRVALHDAGSDAPVITEQPAPASVSPGASATFSIAAAAPSGAALAYRWQKARIAIADHGPFSGAATPALAVDPVLQAETGRYRCLVTNLVTGESTTSAEVALSIAAAGDLVIHDTFTLNGFDRLAGAPLDGTVTEIGAREWHSDDGVVLAAGGSVAAGAAASGPPLRQAHVAFDASAFPGQVVSVAAVVDPRDSRWAAIGFAHSEDLPMTQGGTLWMLLRPGGQLEVLAGGTDHRLLTAVVAPGGVGGPRPLQLALDAARRTVTVSFDGQVLLDDVPLPEELELTIAHAGFELNVQDGGTPERLRLDDFAVTAGAAAGGGQAPFAGTPKQLPGRIQAEAFDLGGPGVAYFDTTPGNQAAAPYRAEEWVEAGGTGPFVIAAAEAGEWLEYTVAADAGPYELTVRHANDDPSCTLSVAGAEAGGTADGLLALTAGATWTEQTVGFLTFAGGQAVLRLTFEGRCGAIDWLRLDAGVASSGQLPFPGPGPTPLPGRLEVENFDAVLGASGQYISYLDHDDVNLIGDYRDEGPDLHTLSVAGVPGERTVLERTFVNEWLEYTVDLAPGRYDLAVHYKSDASEQDQTVTLELLDTGVAFTVDLPAVGFGEGTWNPPAFGLARDVALPGGRHVLRLTLGGAHADLDWIEFAAHEEVPLTAVDDVIVPAVFDPVNAAYDVPVEALLANDSTDGGGAPEIVAVDLWGLRGHARLSDDRSTVRFHVGSSAFWHQRLGWFDYTVRDPAQPFYTATGRAFLVPGGPLASADAVLTGDDCQVVIPFDHLLANDLPAGKVSFSRLVPPSPAQVSAVAGGLAWSGACPPDQGTTFDYQVVLDQNPTATGTATVHVFRDNPVVAADDTLLVPWNQLSAFAIPHSALLANDQPLTGQAALGLAVVETPFPVLTPSGVGILLPNVGAAFRFTADADHFFSPQGASAAFDYTAILFDNQVLTDQATVHLLPQASAVGDVLLVPHSPGLEVIEIPNSALLANDRPSGRIHVVGAQPAGEDKPARDDAVLDFYPGDDFWTTRTATFPYEIYLDQHEERVTTGEVTLIAANGAQPAPDVLVVPAGHGSFQGGPAFFAQSGNQSQQQPPHVLANDQPAGLVRVVPPSAPQSGPCATVTPSTTDGNFHGWWFDPGPAFYSDPACSPARFTYTMEIAAAFTVPTPSATATATVYLFPGAAPPLLANDNQVTAYPGVPATITHAQLLADDQGVGLEVHDFPTAPAHGALAQGPSAVDYLPGPGFDTEDAFTYRMRDAYGRVSPPATVRIEALPSPVEAVEDAFLLPAGTEEWPLWNVELVANDRPSGRVAVDTVGAPRLGELVATGPDRWAYRPRPDFWAAGADSFPYTIGWLDHPQLGAEGRVLIEALPACDTALAADAFDTDLASWDAVVADGGAVSLSAAAAVAGPTGLAIEIDPGAAAIYLAKALGGGETHVRARFFLDPNALAMTEGTQHAILVSGQAAGGVTLAVELRRQDGAYHLVLSTRTDDGGWRSAMARLVDQPQRVDLEWRAASGPQAADGVARLWLDGLRVVDLTALDNDRRVLSGLKLGAVYGLDERTAGSVYFDQLAVCRGESARTGFAADDFESGTLDAWDQVVAAGGLIQPAPGWDLEGALSLLVGIGDGGALAVVDRSPPAVSGYHADFLVNAEQIALQPGKQVALFTGSASTGAVFQLMLQGKEAGRALLAQARTESGWVSSAPIPLPPGGRRIHLAWRAASLPGSADGSLALVLDDAPVAVLEGLDNASARIDTVRLGLPFGSPPGVGGALYFDDFRSWR